jgi:hypothetical protein
VRYHDTAWAKIKRCKHFFGLTLPEPVDTAARLSYAARHRRRGSAAVIVWRGALAPDGINSR